MESERKEGNDWRRVYSDWLEVSTQTAAEDTPDAIMLEGEAQEMITSGTETPDNHVFIFLVLTL